MLVDYSSHIVVRTRTDTPDDQLLASLERIGPISSIKVLPPSPKSTITHPKPLKLAVFVNKEDASKVLDQGFIIVRGQRLDCRPFYSKGSSPSPRETDTRPVAWLTGLPASYIGVDMVAVCKQVHGAQWSSRRCSDRRQVMEIRFTDMEARLKALDSQLILSGRITNWALTKPCFNCSKEGHETSDCRLSDESIPVKEPDPKSTSSCTDSPLIKSVKLSNASVAIAVAAIKEALAPIKETIMQLQKQLDDLSINKQ